MPEGEREERDGRRAGVCVREMVGVEGGECQCEGKEMEGEREKQRDREREKGRGGGGWGAPVEFGNQTG
jgi:hypothetical protein